MKIRTSPVIIALALLTMLAGSALPQPVASAEGRTARAAAHTARTASIDSIVPRDGVQFYLELRKGGLMQMTQAATVFAPFAKVFTAGAKGPAPAELAGFMMSHLGTLANSRVALVGYGQGQTAAVIETTSPAEADQLRADIARLLANNQSGMDVGVEGRVVMAGTRDTVVRLSGSSGEDTLGTDQEFMQARVRFADDPFFGYVEITRAPIPWPETVDAAQNAAYTAGAMSALSSMPYAIAVGGSLDSNTASLRALLLFTPSQKGGLFSSIMSSTQTGMPAAANLVAPDADIFAGLMIDWDKLYEGMQSFFATISSAAAQASADSSHPLTADPFTMAEASFGFSIKKDLLPTLGNEVAVSLKGIESLYPAAGASKGMVPAKASMPRFALMIAVKEPARLERLVTKIFNMPGGMSQPFSQAFHRGARINYRNGFAYAISGGFLILSGSPADIRRALDARATGTALGSTEEFRSAMGQARPSMMQVYLSSAVTSTMHETMRREAAKTNPDLAGVKAGARVPIGFVMTPDANNLLVEMRAPTSFAVMALGSMMTAAPATHGIASPTSGQASRGNRKTPKLTTDDVKYRRLP